MSSSRERSGEEEVVEEKGMMIGMKRGLCTEVG